MSHPFSELIDLASERLGGAVIYASDEFFAGKDSLLMTSRPVWKEDIYTDRGKWMDGWESRRRFGRIDGNDFCIIRLGVPGILRGVVVDTAYFRGNYPEAFSLEGSDLRGYPPAADVAHASHKWTSILPRTALRGDAEDSFKIHCPFRFSHVRLSIYPDGGVARIRLHGEALPEWDDHGGTDGEIDLASAECGGVVVACTDMFFGSRHNLIYPGRGNGMHDGWETRRRRGPGHDFAVIRLAAEGTISRAIVDTSHFKGNAPDRFSLEGAPSADGPWEEISPETKLEPHTRHIFHNDLATASGSSFTHVRLHIYPDGGVSRLCLWGRVTASQRALLGLRRLNALLPDLLEQEFLSCCGAHAWAKQMMRSRPFEEVQALESEAERVFSRLRQEDWLEAFRAHPKIGQRAGAGWPAKEQSGIASATDQALRDLETLNQAYEERFGFIYIVCATGKTAPEMLEILRSRMQNDAKTELDIAAEEQRKITRIRLEKLILGRRGGS